jgi:hypothetical protein
MICVLFCSNRIYTAELTAEDIAQCHQYSALAAKYQAAKQAGHSLQDVLKGITSKSEIQFATQIYNDIDAQYSTTEIRRVLFQQCAKSFSVYRENELAS